MNDISFQKKLGLSPGELWLPHQNTLDALTQMTLPFLGSAGERLGETMIGYVAVRKTLSSTRGLPSVVFEPRPSLLPSATREQLAVTYLPPVGPSQVQAVQRDQSHGGSCHSRSVTSLAGRADGSALCLSSATETYNSAESSAQTIDIDPRAQWESLPTYQRLGFERTAKLLAETIRLVVDCLPSKLRLDIMCANCTLPEVPENLPLAM